jgi:hypothetical protein
MRNKRKKRAALAEVRAKAFREAFSTSTLAPACTCGHNGVAVMFHLGDCAISRHHRDEIASLR